MYATTKLDTWKVQAAMTTELDYGVGNITAALQETGLWNDTLLLFWSDNGGEFDWNAACCCWYFVVVVVVVVCFSSLVRCCSVTRMVSMLLLLLFVPAQYRTPRPFEQLPAACWQGE